MKKLATCVILGLAFLAITGVVGWSADKPAPGKIFQVDLRSQQFGTQSYIIGTAVEELTKTHPWLRVSNLESPGASWAALYMGSTPSAWPNTIATYSAFTVEQCMNGEGSFKGKAKPALKDYRALWSNANLLIHFMTFDPKIKTVDDLAGKRVGMGTKGGGAWAQIPTLLFKILGINAKLEYLGNRQSQKALVDGKVDAAICCTYANVENTKLIPNVVYTETTATPGKQTYTVSWGEANCRKLSKAVGKLVTVSRVPANVFKNQPEPVWLMASAGGWGVHKTFPDYVVTELIKVWGTNYKKFVDRHAQMQIVSLESMAKGYPKEVYHKAAIKAYEAMGVKW